MRNLKRLAVHEGGEVLEWFNAYTQDRDNRERLIKQYSIRCPPNNGAARGYRG